jgi:hypothetical protein
LLAKEEKEKMTTNLSFYHRLRCSAQKKKAPLPPTKVPTTKEIRHGSTTTTPIKKRRREIDDEEEEGNVLRLPTHQDLGFSCFCNLCTKQVLVVVAAREHDLEVVEDLPVAPVVPDLVEDLPVAPVVPDLVEDLPVAPVVPDLPRTQTTAAAVKLPVFVARPPFVREDVERKLVESCEKNNLTLILGDPRTGKTTMARRIAFLCRRQIHEIDDLDYDNGPDSTCVPFVSTYAYMKNHVIIVDVVDTWPPAMMNRLLALATTEKCPSSYIILGENAANANVKKLVDVAKKAKALASCTRLYTRAPFTHGFDRFSSEFDIMKNLGGTTASFRCWHLSDGDFLLDVFHGNYLNGFPRTTTKKKGLEATRSMAAIAAHISDMSILGRSHRPLAIDDFQALHRLGKLGSVKYPNGNFLKLHRRGTSSFDRDMPPSLAGEKPSSSKKKKTRS